MNLSQNLFNENEIYVTPSDIIEFMYCNRFSYFMKCLGIRQYEEKRYKVVKGRNLHDEKSKNNVEYVRKRIKGIAKYNNVQLVSKKYLLKGIVDEIYVLEDGTYAPLDYKFAEYKEKDFLTYKSQMSMYSLMIEDIYKCKVNKFYLVYCRSKNLIKEIIFDNKLRKETLRNIDNYLKVSNGYFPRATKYKSRCLDCCYKNICMK